MLVTKTRATPRTAALFLALTFHAAAAVKIEKIDFRGWPNSYRISNGTVEVVVTSDIGPRIMRYAYVGGQNLFAEFKDQLGKSGEPKWQARGGHRVWSGPEDAVKTYAPDNGPVRIEIKGDVLEATQPVSPLTGLEKKIIVRMASTGTGVEVIHQIRNAGKAPYDLAVWSLTMMAQGGTVVHGLPPRGSHDSVLGPTNPLTMWAYTDFTDPRLRVLKRYVVLHQDPHNSEAEKVGSFNHETWGAYLLNGELFVKKAAAPGAITDYPDFGCSFETFTNNEFLEIETLGAVVKLAPGTSATHTETWALHKGVQVGEWSDAEIERAILPLVKQ